MKKDTTEKTKRTSKGRKQWNKQFSIGLDLGDRSSRYCVLNGEGEVVQTGAVATTRKDLNRVFGARGRCRLALEVGTHSPWVSRHLKGLG